MKPGGQQKSEKAKHSGKEKTGRPGSHIWIFNLSKVNISECKYIKIYWDVKPGGQQKSYQTKRSGKEETGRPGFQIRIFKGKYI